MIVAVKTNYHTRGALPAVRLVSRDKLYGMIYPPIEHGDPIELICSKVVGERGAVYLVNSYSEALRIASEVLQQKADKEAVALCAELDSAMPPNTEVLTGPIDTAWTMPKWVVPTKGK